MPTNPHIYCFFKDACQSIGAVLKALELTCGDDDVWTKDEKNGKFYFYLNLETLIVRKQLLDELYEIEPENKCNLNYISLLLLR